MSKENYCVSCIKYLSQSSTSIPLMARKLNCPVGPSILVRSQYHLAVPVLASVSISAGPQHCIVLSNLSQIILYCIAQPVPYYIVLPNLYYVLLYCIVQPVFAAEGFGLIGSGLSPFVRVVYVLEASFVIKPQLSKNTKIQK